MCRFQKDLSVVNITSWAILPVRDEKALEAAVATIGPVAASINASPKTFQLYQLVSHFICSEKRNALVQIAANEQVTYSRIATNVSRRSKNT